MSEFTLGIDKKILERTYQAGFLFKCMRRDAVAINHTSVITVILDKTSTLVRIDASDTHFRPMTHDRWTVVGYIVAGTVAMIVIIVIIVVVAVIIIIVVVMMVVVMVDANQRSKITNIR